MKALIASDKFKGSLTAAEVCRAIEQAVLELDPSTETLLLPLADGGEGTLDVLEKSLGLKTVEITVSDPLFRPIKSSYCTKGKDAYIEMARASGFELLTDDERSATKTTSLGTGELVKHAIENGAENIFLFVGGSATNDGGIGMASALGFRFLDDNSQEVLPVGENLSSVRFIENTDFPDQISMYLVTDVENLLIGTNGASHQYGPQKGASPEEVTDLERGMVHLSNLVKGLYGKDVSGIPGSGAAGGMGLSVIGLMNGSIQNGIETILDIVNFEDKLQGADYVITGEGKIDIQTLQGKVVHGVAKYAARFGVPAFAICGVNELLPNQAEQLKLKAIASIKTSELSVEYCMQNADRLIVERVKEMIGKTRKS